MNCSHLYSLVLAIIGAVQPVALLQQTNDVSNAPYGIGTMPTGMQMTSDMTSEAVSMPSTSISVDLCPCSSLVQRRDPAKTLGQAHDRSPFIFVSIFQSVAPLACKEKRYPNRVKSFLEDYA